MIGQKVLHYVVLEKLGKGGMGVVYKAHDTKLDRIVALKFLPKGLTSTDEEKARFVQEARAASALNHPNVCTVHDIQEYEGEQFIVMEFVDGSTMRNRIAESGLRIEEAIEYAIQIAEALEEAHSKGIVHRDIKSENIMVTTKNQVKVLDFGLAKLRGSLKLTRTSSTLGTLAYMSPEQIRGGEVDVRSDIFSFGVVLYEMLSGRLPFRGDHEAALLYAIVNQNPEPLQNLLSHSNSELLDLLDRALDKDPDKRYQSVSDLLVILGSIKKEGSRVADSVQREASSRLVRSADWEPGMRHRGVKVLLLVGAGVILMVVLMIVVNLPIQTGGLKLNPNPKYVQLPIPFKELQSVSISTDGKWVVFPAADALGGYDVYTLNLAGTEPNKVTSETAYTIASAEISPDGSQIAYDVGNAPPFHVNVAPFQGGLARTVADTGVLPRWRPDGKRIAYIRAGLKGTLPSASGRLEVWSVCPDGTGRQREFVDSLGAIWPPSVAGSYSCCWSPDGQSIAWTRNLSEVSSELVVRELATGRERQITNDGRRVDQVQWLANGNILFVSNRSGNSNLWAVSLGSGEMTQITQGASPVTGGRASSDARRLAYVHQKYLSQLWISSLNGKKVQQLTFDNSPISYAALSPDGKHISASIGKPDWNDNESELCVMDRDGKNRRILASGEIIVGRSRWSPDGTWLAYSVLLTSDPADSTDIVVIQPFGSAPARRLCRGKDAEWIDNETLAIWTGARTLQYPLRGGIPQQVYQDSTFAVPIQNKREILFRDFRSGREGMWRVNAVGESSSVLFAKLPEYMELAVPIGGEFVMTRMHGTYPIWRAATSGGTNTVVGRVPDLTMWIKDVSVDGQAVLYIKESFPATLVLVEDVFE